MQDAPEQISCRSRVKLDVEGSSPADSRDDMIRVKVCCILSVEEAHLAVSLGASSIGLVSSMPSGPGVISEDTIAIISRTIPPGVATFLLTSAQDPEQIIAQQRRCHTDTIQLCDRVEPQGHRFLREAMPGIRLVQVIHVTGQESIQEACDLSKEVDAILLDSGDPRRAKKELGGTGRAHDWTISQRIRELVGVPVYLAGGLNANNVKAAMDQVRPFGVDVCSGVRTDGKLDRQKLGAFLAAVWRH